MKIKIYADGANYQDIILYNNLNLISGLTTNPSLMKKSGVKNYEVFAKKVLKKVNKKPISFEVFADEIDEMYIQAKKIASWGKNVFVKIPIINTKGKSMGNLIKQLSNEKIKLNITAVFTQSQVMNIFKNLNKSTPAIISIFAGRIADTGRDPKILVKKSISIFKKNLNHKILWASTREIYNITEANNLGTDIITVPTNLLGKINLKNKNLFEYSIETVKEFFLDAKKSKFKI